jgi:Uma2 family endonuclease
MRVEMLPVGFDHGNDHVVLIFAVNLFTALKGIPATGLDTTTFRKTGQRESQLDVSYYLGRDAQSVPSGTGVINLDQYPAPNLVIEISKSSFLDDIVDRCEKSFCALRTRNDFSPLGPRGARPQWRN